MTAVACDSCDSAIYPSLPSHQAFARKLNRQAQIALLPNLKATRRARLISLTLTHLSDSLPLPLSSTGLLHLEGIFRRMRPKLKKKITRHLKIDQISSNFDHSVIPLTNDPTSKFFDPKRQANAINFGK